MRNSILLAFLVLSGIHLAAQQPGNSLSGMVKDSAGGKPLAGVSVFLNNTSRGTITRSDGSFLLSDIPAGVYQLVFSAIGYATTVRDVNGARLPGLLTVTLHQKATELAAVTVEPYDRNGWSKWGRFFRDNFIGTGENASSCSIRNKEVLRFYFSKRSNLLRITAAQPLIVENKALGYRLEYRLEAFTCDYNAQVVSYFGYPFFKDLTPKKEKRRRAWIEKRQEAYTGSMMHFMRSLYAGRIFAEDFLAEEPRSVPNEERRRIRAIYNPNISGLGKFPMDTLYYFRKVMKEPDPIIRQIIMPQDSLITIDTAGNKRLYFDGLLYVTYGSKSRSRDSYGSGIQLVSKTPITVEENGAYYPVNVLLITGHWAQSEKISNLLPLDYGL